MLGKTISHYRISGEIGKGGMGVVYEAEDVRLGRPVALKFLAATLAGDPRAVKGFQREARAASALNHPNICTLYDLGEHEGVPYLVMERLSGETLKSRLTRGPLDGDELLEIALAVASALSAAGEKGIVHRDLKPSNILLTPGGSPKILDFGIAKMVAADPHREADPATAPFSEDATAPGIVAGTLRYMSPEQLRGEKVDHRTDLFSFGIILHQMVTGDHPFAAPTPALVADAILHREPTVRGTEGSGRLNAFSEVIGRALRKDRKLRYQTAGEIRIDLLRIRGLLDAPTAGLAPSPPPRPSLPVPSTSFVGRTAEIEAVRAAIERRRLVTLTGPGGTGKTRLALRAAELSAARYRDGVFFVELAGLRDPGLFDSAVARAVGLRETPDVRLAGQLIHHLSTREILLVLDNFEQLLAAAPRVAELLEAAPGLGALVTSRELLRVTLETEIPVPPLGLSGAATEGTTDARISEAVALFEQRARAANPRFALGPANEAAVAGICARLDGLPLAIELAAARVRHLTPAALLQRLAHPLALLTGGARDLPARQQTLRNAIGWSHELLTPDERTLFARLALFSGGFTLEAAEAVSERIGPLGMSVLDGITSLVDKNLVRPPAGEELRYSMLEIMREFGLEQLEAAGDSAQAHRAHAEYFKSLVGSLAPGLFDSRRVAHIARLTAEYDNLQGALSWRVSKGGERSLGQEIAGGLLHFWVMANLLWEGATALGNTLGEPGAHPTPARARVLTRLALILWLLGDHERSAACAAEGLESYRTLGNEGGVAEALAYLSVVCESRGRHAEARRLLAESVAIYSRLGLRHWRAFTMANAIEPDDLDAARRDCEEALGVLRAQGDAWGSSRALRNLGVVAFRRGDFAEARRRFEETLALQRELGSRWLVSRSLNLLGDTARCEEGLDAAQARYEASQTEEKADGSRANVCWSLAGLGHVALARGDLQLAARHFARGLSARPVKAEKPEHVASCLVGLAEIRCRLGDARGASELLAAVGPLVEDAGRRMAPVDVLCHERTLNSVRSVLGPAALETPAVPPALDEVVARICQHQAIEFPEASHGVGT